MKTKCLRLMFKDFKVLRKTLKLTFWERTLEFNMKKTQTLRQLAVDSVVIQISDKQIEAQIQLSDWPFKMAHMVVNYQVELKSNYKWCITTLYIKKKIHLLDLIRPNRDSHIWKKCKKWVKFLDLALTWTIWTKILRLLNQRNHHIIKWLWNKVWIRFLHQEVVPFSSKNLSISTIRALPHQHKEHHQI